MNKTIRSTTREVIYKVYKRCLEEYEAGQIMSDINDVYRRTADMTVVRLPPYHCDLNPIELIWGITKQKIAAQNVGSVDIKVVAEQAFDSITAEIWKKSCEHVINIENEYYQRGRTLYADIEQIVINLQDDSSSSDSDNISITSESEHGAGPSSSQDFSDVEYLDDEYLSDQSD